MSILSKTDLAGHYAWSHAGEDDPRISGQPDTALLNRGEGYEVLYFLNAFAQKHNLNRTGALRAEQGVHKTPGHLRSRQHIAAWLLANWNSI